MYLKISDAQYDLMEFDLFVNGLDRKPISVIEMLVDCSIDEFEAKKLEEVFSIGVDEDFYTFAEFEVNEIYEDGGFVRIICVK